MARAMITTDMIRVAAITNEHMMIVSSLTCVVTVSSFEIEVLVFFPLSVLVIVVGVEQLFFSKKKQI